MHQLALDVTAQNDGAWSGAYIRRDRAGDRALAGAGQPANRNEHRWGRGEQRFGQMGVVANFRRERRVFSALRQRQAVKPDHGADRGPERQEKRQEGEAAPFDFGGVAAEIMIEQRMRLGFQATMPEVHQRKARS